MAAVPSRSQAELRTVGDRGHKLHLHPGPHLSAGAEWSTARGLPKGSQGAQVAELGPAQPQRVEVRHPLDFAMSFLAHLG